MKMKEGMLFVTLDGSNLGGSVKLWRKRPHLHGNTYNAGAYQDPDDYIELPSSAYTGPGLKMGEMAEVLLLPYDALETILNDYRNALKEEEVLRSQITSLRLDNESLRRKITETDVYKESEARAGHISEMVKNLNSCLDASVVRKQIANEIETANSLKKEAKDLCEKYTRLIEKEQAPFKAEQKLRLFAQRCLWDVFDLIESHKSGSRMDEETELFFLNRYEQYREYFEQKGYNNDGKAVDKQDADEEADNQNEEEAEHEASDDSAAANEEPDFVATETPKKTIFEIDGEYGAKHRVTETENRVVVDNVNVTVNMATFLTCFDDEGQSRKNIVYAALDNKEGYAIIQIAVRRKVITKKLDYLTLTPLGMAIKKNIENGKIHPKH